jgi:hypothetical protein
MRARRRATVPSAAAASAWLLAATGPLAAPPATAASTRVPVTVTVVDTAGDPVAGFTIFSYAGPDDDDGTYSRTDDSGVVVLEVPPYTPVLLGIWIARETPGGPEFTELTVDAGPTGASTTVIGPVPMAHTYRVLDPQGRPVSKADVRMDVLVSTVVSDPVLGEYRMARSWPWPVDTPGLPPEQGSHYPGPTGVDGRTEPMRWWQPEPDPAVACAPGTAGIDPQWCDRDQDGTPDGMFVILDGPYSPMQTGVSVPYTQWAVPGSQEITLRVPAVPVIEVVDQRRGKRPGEAVLTVRAREPSGTSWVPAARLRLDVGLGSPQISSAPPWRTDSRGFAVVRYRNLSGPTTVSVTRSERAAIAATATLKPKRGVLVGRTQHTLVGAPSRSRASVNAEYVTLINTADRPVRLRGWTVTTHAGKRYTFGRYTLRPGAQVTLHSGRGTNTRTDRYWGSRRPLLGSSDTVNLRRPSGTVAASCRWVYNTGGTYDPGVYVPEGTARCVV